MFLKNYHTNKQGIIKFENVISVSVETYKMLNENDTKSIDIKMNFNTVTMNGEDADNFLFEYSAYLRKKIFFDRVAAAFPLSMTLSAIAIWLVTMLVISGVRI